MDDFVPDTQNAKDDFVPDSPAQLAQSNPVKMMINTAFGVGQSQTKGLDYLLTLSGMKNAVDPRQLLQLAAAPAEAAGDPRNVQAAIAAAKMQPAAPGTPMAGQAVNLGYRYGAPLAAAMALPASMASVPVAAGIRGALGGGMLARGLGAVADVGAGALEQGAVGGGTSMAQNIIAGKSLEESAKSGVETGKTFAEGQLAGQAGTKGLELGARGISKGIQFLTERAGSLVSGIKPGSFQMLKDFGDKVMAYAQKGMTIDPISRKPVPVALNDAQGMALRAQELIDEHAAGAGKEFNAMLEHLADAPESAKRIPVAGDVYDAMEPYIEKFTRYRDAVKSQTDSSAAGVFNHYYDRIKSTLQEGMSPKEAASLLGAMTEDQRVYKGTQLSAHLGKLKESLLDAIPEYSKSFEPLDASVWNIAETRANYRAAKQLQGDLAPFAKSHNPLQAIDSASRAGGSIVKSIEKFAAVNPEFKQILSEIPIARAGADFAPTISNNLPRTGLTGAAGLMAAKLTSGNMAALPELALFGIGASPKTTGTVINTAKKITPSILDYMQQAQSYERPTLQMALGLNNESRR